MKKIVIMVIMLMMLMNTANACVYTKCVVVIDVEDTCIMCVDDNGDVWAFYGSADDEWTVGETLILMMEDNSTVTIYDDCVIDVLVRSA